MKNIVRFEDFDKINEQVNNNKIINWLNKIKRFSMREANETRIASKILRKIIRKNLNLSKEVITPEEIKFLKDHSKDLIKILGFIATGPTPVPYVGISIMLKKIGINLFPSKEDLDIPEEYKKVRSNNTLTNNNS